MNLASRSGCSRAEFKRAVLIGTGESLDDPTVDIVFTLFDKNKDGRLDTSEFYEILRSRQTRGLHSARDTGIVNFACVSPPTLASSLPCPLRCCCSALLSPASSAR